MCFLLEVNVTQRLVCLVVMGMRLLMLLQVQQPSSLTDAR